MRYAENLKTWKTEMGKYDPLRRHLENAQADRVVMRFSEIEAILGLPLPASARRHAAWWSNSGERHAQAGAWLGAGYESAELDLDLEKVSFRATMTVQGMSEGPQAHYGDEVPPGDFVTPSAYAELSGATVPLFGCMKGTLTVSRDVDVTGPADPEWAKIYDKDHDNGAAVPGNS